MRRIWITGAIAFALCISACGPTQGPVVVSASWARLYHDIKSLKADADVVAIGHVTGSQPAPGETPPATDFAFRLDDVLHVKGTEPAVTGVTVTVHQTGGVLNGQTYVVEDDPRFTVGEKDLVFLTRYAPGKYFVLGGPTGRFPIGADGMVRPLNDEGVQLAPTSLGAMEAQIQSA